MKHFIAILLIGFSLWFSASAQSPNAPSPIRDEIMQYAVDPCFKHQANVNGFSEHMGEAEAVKLLKVHYEGFVKVMIRLAALNVMDIDRFENRLHFYRRSADRCIKSFAYSNEEKRKEEMLFEILDLE